MGLETRLQGRGDSRHASWSSSGHRRLVTLDYEEDPQGSRPVEGVDEAASVEYVEGLGVLRERALDNVPRHLTPGVDPLSLTP